MFELKFVNLKFSLQLNL